MSRTVASVLVAVAVSALPGCGLLGLAVAGSGFVVEQEYAIEGFEAVEAGSGFELDLRPGDAYAVVVRADDNILPHVSVSREGGRLLVTLEPGYAYLPTCLRALVTLPSLAELELTGGARGCVAEGFRISGRFSLAVSGGSRVSVNGLECGSLAMELSGGSAVAGEVLCPRGETMLTLSGGSGIGPLRGQTAGMALEQSGGGSTDLSGFLAQSAAVTLSGGAEARVSVASSLNVSLSGGSSLEYRRYDGGPAFAAVVVTGGSRLVSF
jgi:hypothetical protein